MQTVVLFKFLFFFYSQFISVSSVSTCNSSSQSELWNKYRYFEKFQAEYKFYLKMHYCCAASIASGQQHKQDLRRIYIEGDTNSRIHHFLPECIAFNQSALRHFLPECIVPRTTRGCHTVEPSSYFA